MDRWDVFIILAAGYVAVMSLVRMMARRRNQVVDHVREQLVKQRGKKKKKPKSKEESSRKTDRDAA